MGPIAERFVFGMPAAAQPDGGASGKIERRAGGVADREFPFKTHRSVVVDRDFGHGNQYTLLTTAEAESRPAIPRAGPLPPTLILPRMARRSPALQQAALPAIVRREPPRPADRAR